MDIDIRVLSFYPNDTIPQQRALFHSRATGVYLHDNTLLTDTFYNTNQPVKIIRIYTDPSFPLRVYLDEIINIGEPQELYLAIYIEFLFEDDVDRFLLLQQKVSDIGAQWISSSLELKTYTTF